LINVGAILYRGDFEVGVILINVVAILTGAILQWDDLIVFRNGQPIRDNRRNFVAMTSERV
jgi:hypothetical protein